MVKSYQPPSCEARDPNSRAFARLVVPTSPIQYALRYLRFRREPHAGRAGQDRSPRAGASPSVPRPAGDPSATPRPQRSTDDRPSLGLMRNVSERLVDLVQLQWLSVMTHSKVVPTVSNVGEGSFEELRTRVGLLSHHVGGLR